MMPILSFVAPTTPAFLQSHPSPSLSFSMQQLKPPNYIHHRHIPGTNTPSQQRHHSASTRHATTNDFSGLTEDGDFAILGVNMADDATSESNRNQNSYGGSSTGNLPLDAFASLLGNNTPSMKKSPTGNVGTTGSVRSGQQGNEVGIYTESSRNDSSIDRMQSEFAVDERTLVLLKEWLLEIMPSLNQSDLDNYARGLERIGFSPECVTMCELQYEDLGFMKVLHRRYLYNEVAGNEHPWEA